MTTPLTTSFDEFMPYTVEFFNDQTLAYMLITQDQRQASRAVNNYTHYLPAGVYDLQLSYTGVEAAEIWLTQFPGGKNHAISRIPATTSGVPRLGRLERVQSDGRAFIRVTTTPRPNQGQAADATAAVNVIPYPRYSTT